MATIAFCLLTYRPDHPSGLERSMAALMEGVRRMGHTPIAMTGSAAGGDQPADVDLVCLSSVVLPRPALNSDVLAALAEPAPVVDEVRTILVDLGVDAVCWVDTLWGLGFLHPAPPGVRTALMVHKIRPRSEQRWHAALAAADVICPASGYLRQEARQAGYDTSRWTIVPNALLTDPMPVAITAREVQRSSGPIRIATRVEPAKGLVELVRALPDGWMRPVELALAEADFEFWPGMQQQVIDACRAEVARRASVVTLVPPLPWLRVPAFLAGAAATIISSTEPETFCNAAAEALSVGTPVVAFDHGHVPALTGAAGRCVALSAGAAALWQATEDLLDDVNAYHTASRAAAGQVRGHTPGVAAEALLTALRLETKPR